MNVYLWREQGTCSGCQKWRVRRHGRSKRNSVGETNVCPGLRGQRTRIGDRRRCPQRAALAPSCRPRLRRQRLAAGLSAELPQVQREALLLPSADNEAGLLDQLLRGAIEMAAACEPAP